MAYDSDPKKAADNLRNHGVPFDAVESFEFRTAKSELQVVHGEVRAKLTGLIGNRLHVLILTNRGGNTRIISLRKANKREVRQWNQ